MSKTIPRIWLRVGIITTILIIILILTLILGISMGSSQTDIRMFLRTIFGAKDPDSPLLAIIWQIRLPRALMAAFVGATLSLGGLVFQALLRNPLAEPYILGISGGAAIGGIIGILLDLPRFPGVCATAFVGSMVTLGLVFIVSSGKTVLAKDSLLLSGVILNSFCSAVIMFLVSLVQDARLHNIIFWLMGDLSQTQLSHVGYIAILLVPCFLLIFIMSHSMNLLLMGKDLAHSMGVRVKAYSITLLIITSFIISVTVSYCGLIGFVGLVAPHLLRMAFGSDHRLLVPACIFGGGAYMVMCDLLARTLPKSGEMPVGVITAMIGAPLFIYLLKRSNP
ncbi:Bacterial transport system permease protein [Candidatus Magnetomorum sp. HK-1]|nr:Bacterial transport system permease protein [Candidatus Magnetomorum sp. HK-1]